MDYGVAMRCRDGGWKCAISGLRGGAQIHNGRPWRTHRCGKLLDMFHCSSSIVYTRYELVVVGSLVLYDIDA
jgi:hypothetical protein